MFGSICHRVGKMNIFCIRIVTAALLLGALIKLCNCRKRETGRTRRIGLRQSTKYTIVWI